MSEEAATATLSRLDAAIVEAQRQLHLTTVPNAISDTKGLTSGQWRSVVEVLGVALAAANLQTLLPRSMVRLIEDLTHSLTSWYFLAANPHFVGDDLTQLQSITARLREKLAAAERRIPGVHLSCPKVHRTLHIAHSVQRYGPYDCLTAEMGEAAHKQFKRMFVRYVPSNNPNHAYALLSTRLPRLDSIYPLNSYYYYYLLESCYQLAFHDSTPSTHSTLSTTWIRVINAQFTTPPAQ